VSADLLLWSSDPARALQKRLAEFSRRSQEDAERARRTKEQMHWYQRHPEPPKPAA
jgi:hypothetical protein